MAKGIVVYYSKSGNTQAMAQIIAKSMNDSGLETQCKSTDDVEAQDLLDYHDIMIGFPTYYGQMDGPIKELINKTVSFHSKPDCKVCAAFSSAANIGGGNETTIMGIIDAMFISGMIVQGGPKGDHYGPVSINKPDERVEISVSVEVEG